MLFTTKGSGQVPDPQDALATAYHEAGHAAVLLHFEIPFSSVSVVASGDADGRIRHPSPMMIGESRRARQTAARQLILVAYAGMQAQRLVDSAAQDFHGAYDDENALWLSKEYCAMRGCSWVGDPFHIAYLERLRKEAGRLVRGLRWRIDTIARTLMVHETLTGDQVRALFAIRGGQDR